MDIDITIVLQMGIFLTLLVTLNVILLKPFQRVIEERDAKIEGAQDEAERLRHVGDEAMDKYQLQMREARAKAQDARQKEREAGRDDERKILNDVRNDIANELNKARVEVGEAESVARSALDDKSAALAEDIVAKILGRKVTA